MSTADLVVLPVDRRTLLRAGLAATGAGLLTACSSGRPAGPGRGLILPTDPRVAAREARRRTTGRITEVRLTAETGEVDLGGPRVNTWTYGGVLPGKEIRVQVGDSVRAVLTNRLPTDTTIHWHGLPLRNDMDGAPDLTQDSVGPGGSYAYEFVADTPGTYWFHPHSGTQLDRGLYAPLIVEDPKAVDDSDHDWVVVLDDWIDGTGTDPDEVFTNLRSNPHAMGPMHGTGNPSALLGGNAGDVTYPHYLINGRVPTAPVTFTARPGQRVRIRLINAASDTAFRVALGAHRLRVTHTDGQPVQPVDTSTLLIGMGERYDVTAVLDDGVFPLVAVAEGKGGSALALIRTGAGANPAPSVRPAELGRDVLRYSALQAAPETQAAGGPPDVKYRLDLTGGMMSYDWGINGRPFALTRRLLIHENQTVRLVFRNRTMMWHPMHIHGHTFQLNGTGPRKDTVAVLPGRTVTCDLAADNPGQWMVHCHNTYHSETGMATILGYQL